MSIYFRWVQRTSDDPNCVATPHYFGGPKKHLVLQFRDRNDGGTDEWTDVEIESEENDDE